MATTRSRCGVVRLPHDAHPALADALDEPIPAQKGPGTDGSAFACRSSTCHSLCIPETLWRATVVELEARS